LGHVQFFQFDTTLPAVNIKETEKSYEVEMAAPGMKKGRFQN
jgi:HSP20 family molecular chaperone IbpA